MKRAKQHFGIIRKVTVLISCTCISIHHKGENSVCRIAQKMTDKKNTFLCTLSILSTQFLPGTNFDSGMFEDLSASAKICQVV